jgi:hypothetical protein
LAAKKKKAKKDCYPWWQFYDELEDGSKKCKGCKKLPFAATTTTGTYLLSDNAVIYTSGNLQYHQNRCAGLAKMQKNVDTEMAFIQGRVIIPGRVNKEDNRVINDKLAEWIISESVPLRSVESDKFRAIFSTMNDEVRIYSRRDLGRRINNASKNARRSIISMFEEFEGEVALTTDGWTSGGQDGFMGITVHWISPEWKFCSMTLDMVEAPHTHSGVNLQDLLLKVLKRFKLDKRVISITTDNAENMTLTCKLLSAKLGGDEFFHIRCAAHIINLVATSAFDLIKPRLEKLRGVITFLNSSTKATMEYRRSASTDTEYIKGLDQIDIVYTPSTIGSKRKVPLDVKTRWSSTYHMLDKALRVRDPSMWLTSLVEKIPG